MGSTLLQYNNNTVIITSVTVSLLAFPLSCHSRVNQNYSEADRTDVATATSRAKDYSKGKLRTPVVTDRVFLDYKITIEVHS